jgi:hypothetical protein
MTDLRPALYVSIMGGIGNQLFQAGFALALADALGCAPRFVADSFAGDPYRRSFQLDIFPALRGKLVGSDALAGGVLLKEEQIPPMPFELLVEQIGRLLDQGKPLLLQGYWQNERYLLPKRALIRSLFQPEITQDLSQRLEQIRALGAIGLHVRRGDYGHHGLATVRYYLEAIAAIRRESGALPVICVTDEPNFVRSVFAGVENIHFPGSGNIDNPIEDLLTLAACRHHILANSSFSWWAAWLSEDETSLVFAPQPWNIANPADNPAPPRWRNIAGAVQQQ